MKKTILSLLTIANCFFTVLLPINYYGATTIKDTSVASKVTVNGSGSLKKSSFSKEVTINGVARAENCTFKDEVTISGSANLKECILEKSLYVNGASLLKGGSYKESITVHGSLNAKKTSFSKKATVSNADLEGVTAQEIEITGNSISLKNSTTGALSFIKNTQLPAEQTVKLEGKVTIQGDVTFVANGKLYMNKESSLTGKVINGIIITPEKAATTTSTEQSTPAATPDQQQ